MNQLVTVPEGTRGFVVGPTVNPQTHGIWAWVTKVPGTNKPLLILDTEGFHAMEANDLYDSKIFAVTLLLSSSLIYNTNKIIDQKQIDYLELISRKTELFSIKQELQKNAESKRSANGPRFTSFPPLHWIIRDFSQKLDTTPTEWLHQVLQNFQVDEKGDSQNVTHQSLLSVFEDTDCHTLWFPSEDFNTVQDLNSVGTDASSALLTYKWKSDIVKLREAIFSNIKPKTIAGPDGKMHTVSVPAIATMLEMLVEAANQEKMLMVVQSSWNAFVEKAGNEAIHESTKLLEKTMGYKLEEKPLTQEVFSRELKQSQEQCRYLMKQIALGIDYLYKPFLGPLEQEITRISSRLAEENLNKVKNLCGTKADAAEEELDSILVDSKLPLSRSVLSIVTSDSMQQVLTEFERILKPYYTVKGFEYNKEYSKLKKHLEGTVSQYREKNVKALLKAAETARLEAENVFAQLEEFAELKSDEEFNQRKDELYSDAMISFKTAVSAFSQEGEVTQEQKKLNANILEKTAVCFKKNLETIRKYGNTIISQSTRVHSDMLRDVLLPVEDDELRQVFAKAESRAIKHFDDSMSKYSKNAIFKELRIALHEDIQKINAAKMTENKEVLKVTLREPKERAFKRLGDEVHDYWLRVSFKSHAREILSEEIGDAIRSQSFKAIIVDEFAEEACKKYDWTLKTIVAYGLIGVAILVVVGLVVFMMMKKKSN